MIVSTNLEKPKFLNLKTDKPQIFSGDLTNIWGIWKQIFHALFKSLIGWFWFLIVLNFYILVKKSAETSHESNLYDTVRLTRIRRYWKICMPLKFVLRQTIFIGIKNQHTRIFVCICEGKSIYLNFVYTDTVTGQKVGVNNI